MDVHQAHTHPFRKRRQLETLCKLKNQHRDVTLADEKKASLKPDRCDTTRMFLFVFACAFQFNWFKTFRILENVQSEELRQWVIWIFCHSFFLTAHFTNLYHQTTERLTRLLVLKKTSKDLLFFIFTFPKFNIGHVNSLAAHIFPHWWCWWWRVNKQNDD